MIFSHGLWCSQKDFWYFGYRFPEIGAVGIFFDFCGGSPEGSSDGRMEKMTPFTEEEDLLEVIAYLRHLDYIDPDRVVLMQQHPGLVPRHRHERHQLRRKVRGRKPRHQAEP